MSRCFPFPPPGYERKLDDTNLLKKEKCKGRKHKRDKKHREKRDGNEKREKTYQEKNDKKNKHKEKRVDWQPESQNGDSLLQNNEHNKPKDGSSGHKKSSGQPRNGGHKELLFGKEEYVQSSDENEKMLVNRIKTEDINNSKFVQELGRRIREDKERTGSLQFPVDSRKSNVDRGEIPKIDGQGINNKSTFYRMPMVQNSIDGKKTLERVEEKTELTRADRDKNNYMKNGETIGSFNNSSTYNTPNVGIQHPGGELKKRKDFETNGFSHENEPTPNKSARPTTSILTENGRKQEFLQKPGLSQPGKSTKVDTTERNGTITSQSMSPVSKKPLGASANHNLLKSTSTRSPPVNTCHIPSQPLPVPASRPPFSVPNHTTNKPFSTKPSQPLLNSKKKEPMTPAHPDTKFLKQILMVPKLDQWSGLDNQEWLFCSKDYYPHFKEKAGNIFLQDNMEVEVWSEAKQLEYADVCALPYVIPY